MRSLCLITFVAALALPAGHAGGAESIHSGVVQVRLPREDLTLLFVEARGGMTVCLKGVESQVEGRRLFLGDGRVAVALEATTAGILFQGRTGLNQGFRFRVGSVVRLLPGYRKAAELKPGDVYVTLPGITFEAPDE
jgi:hypothetical protein